MGSASRRAAFESVFEQHADSVGGERAGIVEQLFHGQLDGMVNAFAFHSNGWERKRRSHSRFEIVNSPPPPILRRERERTRFQVRWIAYDSGVAFILGNRVKEQKEVRLWTFGARLL